MGIRVASYLSKLLLDLSRWLVTSQNVVKSKGNTFKNARSNSGLGIRVNLRRISWQYHENLLRVPPPRHPPSRYRAFVRDYLPSVLRDCFTVLGKWKKICIPGKIPYHIPTEVILKVCWGEISHLQVGQLGMFRGDLLVIELSPYLRAV